VAEITTAHDLLHRLALLERERPGAGRQMLEELSEDEQAALWAKFEAEEAVVVAAEGELVLARFRQLLDPEEDHQR
jgi:hypothetical protein